MFDPLLASIGVGAYLWGRTDDASAIDVTAPRSSFEVGNVMTSTRGHVLPLSLAQRRNRALYLAGELGADGLDEYVRAPLSRCASIYYRLRDYNGGKDPTAQDPATRWRATLDGQINATSDCIGGAAWCGGFDRYQPHRFAHIYGGWINTDSMIQDATTIARCFGKLAFPVEGCFIVAGTLGDRIGHIGTVVNVPGGFNPFTDSWSGLGVVDIASRGGGIRANKRTSGAGWQSRGAHFIVPNMIGSAK